MERVCYISQKMTFSLEAALLNPFGMRQGKIYQFIMRILSHKETLGTSTFDTWGRIKISHYLFTHSKFGDHLLCYLGCIIKITGSTWKFEIYIKLKLKKIFKPTNTIWTKAILYSQPVVIWSAPNISSSATLPPILTSIWARSWALVSFRRSFSGNRYT